MRKPETDIYIYIYRVLDFDVGHKSTRPTRRTKAASHAAGRRLSATAIHAFWKAHWPEKNAREWIGNRIASVVVRSDRARFLIILANICLFATKFFCGLVFSFFLSSFWVRAILISQCS